MSLITHTQTGTLTHACTHSHTRHTSPLPPPPTPGCPVVDKAAGEAGSLTPCRPLAKIRRPPPEARQLAPRLSQQASQCRSHYLGQPGRGCSAGAGWRCICRQHQQSSTRQKCHQGRRAWCTVCLCVRCMLYEKSA